MKPIAEVIEIKRRGGELVEDPGYRCAECRDTGWRSARDENGVFSSHRCECKSTRTPAEAREALIFTGMGRSEIEAAFRPWDDEHQPKPVWAREWLEWVLCGAPADEAPSWIGETVPTEPWILTLLGKPGRGKTKTAATLARIYAAKAGSGLVWANASAAFGRVQKERASATFSAYEESIIAAGLLIIDDYGVGFRRDSETLEGTVNHWLYQRFRDQRPTIITANAETFQQLGESRIASRMAAGVYRVMSAGSDYRDRR